MAFEDVRLFPLAEERCCVGSGVCVLGQALLEDGLSGDGHGELGD